MPSSFKLYHQMQAFCQVLYKTRVTQLGYSKNKTRICVEAFHQLSQLAKWRILDNISTSQILLLHVDNQLLRSYVFSVMFFFISTHNNLCKSCLDGSSWNN